MAEIILAVLCLLGGGVCAFFTLLVLWAGALEQAATGSSDTSGALWLAALAVVGIAGGISILVF